MSACEQCRENIAKKNPPTPCPRELCEELAPDINQYCHDFHDPPYAPIPLLTPDGKKCWCCCGVVCSSPVAVGPGEYRPLDSLRRGDTVLVASAGLTAWTPGKIVAMAVPEDASGASFAAELAIDFAGGELRMVTLHSEMLVMTAGGALEPAGRLVPDEALRTADGREAKVRLNRLTSSAVAVPYLGPIDAHSPLSGHLLDVCGLVCADLAVSTAGYAGALPAGVLAPVPERPAALSVSKAS
jgi:hypothetical protein